MYLGATDAASLISFVNSRAQTARRADGTLEPLAGRVPAMARFAALSCDAIAAAVVEVEAEAAGGSGATACASDDASGSGGVPCSQRVQLYARALKRAARPPPDGGAAWVARERARLTRMLDDEQLAPEQASLLMVRRNILASFACGGDDALRALSEPHVPEQGNAAVEVDAEGEAHPAAALGAE